MLSAKDIYGLMGMMPALDFRARDTVDVGRLNKGVDGTIRDNGLTLEDHV
jgi:hypothetical protein